MGQNGGYRPGAGRPRGSKVARTQELVEKHTKNGAVTPIDVLLEDMRLFYKIGNDTLKGLEGKECDAGVKERMAEALRFKNMARDCATAAAPYIHPKLTAISAPNGGPIEVSLKVSFVSPSN